MHEYEPELLLGKGSMQRLKLDFAQDGIHHDKQTDGYYVSAGVPNSLGDLQRTNGYRDTDELPLLQRGTCAWNKVAQ